jgi:hypothetical protein
VSASFRPGDRIRIRSLKDVGSARLLDGISGQVIGPHPIAHNWYKIRLDANYISPHPEWSAPYDRLVPEDEEADTAAPDSMLLSEQIRDGHWP